MNFAKENTFVVGDVHGKIDKLIDIINMYDVCNSLYICVGDFGAGLIDNESDKFTKLNEVLSDKDSDMVIIRGNHDNPAYFTNKQIGRINFVKDYTLLTNNDTSFALIGGAMSIDQKNRTEGYDWFKDENVVMSTANHLKNVDYIITHAAPDQGRWGRLFAPPSMILDEPELLEQWNKERSVMNWLHSMIADNNPNLKTWFFGHYHKSNTHMTYSVTYKCLNELEIHDLR